MKGKRSSLLSEMLRIIEGGHRFFEGRPVRVAHMAEKVAPYICDGTGRDVT